MVVFVRGEKGREGERMGVVFGRVVVVFER